MWQLHLFKHDDIGLKSLDFGLWSTIRSAGVGTLQRILECDTWELWSGLSTHFHSINTTLLSSQLSGAVDFSSLARFYINQAKIRSELTILMKLSFWARFKMFFFRITKFGKFLLIFRPNFLPKPYRAAIWPLQCISVPDGGKNNITVPYVYTYGVR